MPLSIEERVSWLINSGADDTQRGLAEMTGTPDDIVVLKLALAEEQQNDKRVSRLRPIEAKLRKYDVADSVGINALAQVEVVGSEVLLSGPEANALSPQRSADLASIEIAWKETRRLSDLIKTYSRATTAAKTLCGLRLRSIRTFYFGERNPNGGRPKKTADAGGFSSWAGMVAERVGISEATAKVWMQMADAVEAIALAEGTNIQSICEKLPHDWTPDDVSFLDATVHKLTQDKTQRELLQSDFLTGLGYEAPERTNGSNNPNGNNGGKKQPAATAHQKVEGLRTLARTALFGHDSTDHRPKPGSPAFYMNALVQAHLTGDISKSPAASLTKKERAEIYELLIQPYVAAWKALDA